MKKEIGKWICSDPEDELYVRYLGARKYEFKLQDEGSTDAEARQQQVVDLDGYSEEELREVFSSWHCSLEEIRETVPEAEWDSFIAESIYVNSRSEFETKVENVFLTFSDGRKAELQAVFCEVSGQQLCWATIPPPLPGCTAAYIGFQVVNEEGVQVLDDLGGVETF